MSGYRFVLVGVGIAFLVNAGLGYLISRANVNDVREALVWMVGSLGTPGWADVGVLAGVLVVLAPAVALVAPRLRVLQLGDDTAGGLGVRVEVTRVAVLALAVARTAAGIGPGQPAHRGGALRRVARGADQPRAAAGVRPGELTT
ncbi:iron chelate uptake ABC transporter family permease subunit [Georgenia sp. SUBG003]|uniref:iron chelate uptake ABC transporter family permease subunit n=1 Tax=Georgenia sp. SUBG003 TaxID=1497974 RepID=UPI003AB4D893